MMIDARHCSVPKASSSDATYTIATALLLLQDASPTLFPGSSLYRTLM